MSVADSECSVVCDISPLPRWPSERQRRRALWRASVPVVLLVLSVLLAVAGCSREDVRPWMIGYRIYQHCRITFGTLTQKECEAFMAKKPSSTLTALVDCTRDKLCPGIVPYCFKEPIPRRSK